MKQTLDEQSNMLRRYLLQDLEAAELEQIEMKLLTDKEFSRSLAIAQDDLIDNFVAQRLSDYEMDRFRNHYLTTPARLEKLKFATALDKYVLDKELKWSDSPLKKLQLYFRARPLKTAFATIGLLLIFGATLFIVSRLGWFRENDFQTEFVRVNHTQGIDSMSFADVMKSSNNAVAMILRHNLTREDNERRRIEVTRNLTLIRLLLEVPSGSQESYKAILQTAAGEDLVSTENLHALNDNGAHFVLTNVPTKFLSRGDYQLRLIEISNGQAKDVGLYPFQITTK